MSPKFSSHLPRFLVAGTMLAFALDFAGCAHTYSVKVDALCNTEVTPSTSYRLVAHDDVKADFDPQYQDKVQLIENALASRGYYEAEAPRDAEIVVEVDFGVGSRRKSTIDEDCLLADGMRTPAPQVRPHVSRNPTLTPNPAPALPPPTRVTVITLYEKFLTLSARETEKATRGLRKPVELWRVNVAVEDTKQTVDDCLPVLVFTAIDKIGTSTEARERVRVSDRAAGVLLATSEL